MKEYRVAGWFKDDPLDIEHAPFDSVESAKRAAEEWAIAFTDCSYRVEQREVTEWEPVDE